MWSMEKCIKKVIKYTIPVIYAYFYICKNKFEYRNWEKNIRLKNLNIYSEILDPSIAKRNL